MWGATFCSQGPGSKKQVFQSTLPVWGATEGIRRGGHAAEFQSTLPVWGATVAPGPLVVGVGISIHAPRVGSDSGTRPWSGPRCYFNPRSPCGERLLHFPNIAFRMEYFNPRSPCGERHTKRFAICNWRRFQSTLPVWGATSVPVCYATYTGHFNPRSPCGERHRLPFHRLSTFPFQSTLPVWGATSRPCSATSPWTNFNPRSPCGERPQRRR